MKRKSLKFLGIILGVLVILFILIGPAAPLWKRMGLEPFCIQGEWPHIKVVSRRYVRLGFSSCRPGNKPGTLPRGLPFGGNCHFTWS